MKLKKVGSKNNYKVVDIISGKIVFFSIESFIETFIKHDHHCIVCGRSKTDEIFNEEHIIPNWVLKHYKIHNRSITLPNGTPFTYGQYTIDLCVDCNQLMSKELETPISALFKGDISLNQFSESHGLQKIHIWINFIFIKLHIKDLQLRYHRDLRKPDKKIADYYEMDKLHHIHCLSRSIFTGIEVNNDVWGSIYFGNAAVEESYWESFDFIAFYQTRSVLFRFKDKFLISNLNDSGAVFTRLKNAGYLDSPYLFTPMQIRELFAHFSFSNEVLLNRPIYATMFPQNKRPTTIAKYQIMNSTPGWHWDTSENSLIYELKLLFWKNLGIPDKVSNKGLASFLFDSDENYFNHFEETVKATK